MRKQSDRLKETHPIDRILVVGMAAMLGIILLQAVLLLVFQAPQQSPSKPRTTGSNTVEQVLPRAS